MTDPRVVEQTDPEAVFTALAHDTRVAILQALWESDDRATTFSELRETVGVRDSGQFNYHLDKLVGRFVSKTDDGYELTQAGKRINGAIHAGAYTIEATVEPIALEDPCPTCGGSRTLYYEDETVRVECDSCPIKSRFGVPPSVFADCDRASVPDVAGRYLQTTFRRLNDGFCSFCDGCVRPTVGAFAEFAGDAPDDVSDEVVERAAALPIVQYECRRCGATPTGGLRIALLHHPAVVGFYHDRGVDLQEGAVWAFAGLHTDHQRIRSRDPFRASATYAADGDALTLIVDEDLAVLDIEA